MNLNTIRSRAAADSAAEVIGSWRDGVRWLAGGTWLFSEPQLATDTLIDLERLGWPALTGVGRRGTRRSPPRAASPSSYRFTGARGMDGALPLIRQCCSCVPRLVQDLERGDGRRQHLHVAAGRPDDRRSTAALRGRLHAVAARAAAARRCRWSISSPATTQRARSPANCCAASTCRPRRSRKRFAFRRCLADASRPLGGAADRHALPEPASCCSPSPPRRCGRCSSASHVPPAAELRAAIDDAHRRAALYFDDVHGSPAYNAGTSRTISPNRFRRTSEAERA